MKDNNFNTELDLLTDVALDVSESANSITVLIKHDYYSSDNDNGRAMLESFLDVLSLSADRIHLIIITDSAVKLLESSPKLQSLIPLVNKSFVCADSASFYGISAPDFGDKLTQVPMTEITDLIIETRPDLILE